MNLLRSFPLMTFVLVLVGLLGFCAAQKSLEMLVLAGTLAALSWYVTEGPRGRILPRWVSNLLVIAVSIGVVVDLITPPNEVLGVLGRFTVWLTLIKLYERRTARDHAHLMGLSLLLMLIGSLEPNAELLFGILLVAYAAIGLYVLLLFQLYAAHEEARASRRREMPVPSDGLPALRPTVGRHAGLQFRLLVTAIAGAAVIGSVFLFVVFPRDLGRGMLGPRLTSPVRSPSVEYSDEIDLISGTRITESRRKVFELEVNDGTGPVRLDEPILLRGAVLERYDRGRWSRAIGRRSNRPQRIADVRTTADGAGASLLRAVPFVEEPTLTLRLRFPSGTDTIFSMYMPVRIASAERAHFAYDRATQTLHARGETRLVWGYTVDVVPDPTEATAAAGSLGGDRNASSRGYRDEIGQGSVADLAERLLREAGVGPAPSTEPARFVWGRRAAEVFTEYLRSDAFTYTLDLSGVAQKYSDPVRNFLLDSRRGHCEYFASALAALCEMAGVDARMVTGYVVYDYDESLGRYIGLASNAHAWVEVRAGRSVWTPMDPTPPAVLQTTAAMEPPLGERLGWLYERFEDSWATNVVEYDGRAQTDLLERLDAGWTQRLSALLDDARRWLAGWSFSFGAWGYVWMGTVVLVAIIAVLALLTVVRRYTALRRTMRVQRFRDAEARRALRQLGFYLDMLIALRRHGLPKPPWQPPLAFAAAVADRRPAVGDLVRSITEVYYAGRYGLERLDREALARARSMVGELEQTLRSRR